MIGPRPVIAVAAFISFPMTSSSTSGKFPCGPWNGCVFMRMDWRMWLVILLGWILNWVAFAPLEVAVHDEYHYATYCRFLSHDGLGKYPFLTSYYLEEMYSGAAVSAPPTRFAHLATAALCHVVTGIEEHRSLAVVSMVSSMLLLAWCAFFASRILPSREAIAVVLLMACAPLRLHLGGKGLNDGFFTLWAMVSLGSLWFYLQPPNSRKWLALYAASLLILVMTKENSVFIWFAMVVLLVIAPWIGLSRPTAAAWRTTILAPMVAVTLLVLLAGGWGRFVEIYTAFVVKGNRNAFTVLTGDGPWYRYWLDLFMLSPLVVLLCFAGLGGLRLHQRPLVYLACFMAATWLGMLQLKYGGNLRYTAVWDFPMRVFVVVALAGWAARFGSRQRVLFLVAVLAVSVQDLSQYYRIFMKHHVYEPTPEYMLRAMDVIKSVDDAREELKSR